MTEGQHYPGASFAPQVWITIIIGVAAAAFFGGQVASGLSGTSEKYVSRTEYLAAIATLHEQIVDIKSTVSSVDLYLRQNLPERKR